MTNKEILSEIDKIKVNIKELEEKASELEKKVKEEKKSKVWKPKTGEKIWVLLGSGKLGEYYYAESDSSYYGMGMMFQTKQQAERKKFEMQLEKKLKDFALENNEGEIDWNNANQEKYYITYDCEDEEMCTTYTHIFKDINVLAHFTAVEIAQRAIETFEGELERYFTRED